METPPGPIQSDTGELAWHRGADGNHGVVTVDTGRSQALAGFLAANPKSTKNVSARLDTPFASLVLSALDGKPIAVSARLLLTAGSRVANTGMQWNPARTGLTQQGSAPSLIEPVSGDIMLVGLEKAVDVKWQPLDGAGHALGPGKAAERADGGWKVTIGDPATTWYSIAVQR